MAEKPVTTADIDRVLGAGARGDVDDPAAVPDPAEAADGSDDDAEGSDDDADGNAPSGREQGAVAVSLPRAQAKTRGGGPAREKGA